VAGIGEFLGVRGGGGAHRSHDVDQEERLQLERVVSTGPSAVEAQAQLQLDRAQSAVSPDDEVLHEDRLHELFV
jgi:hypothetical protein